MATFPDETFETKSGTITAWLPLSTPWVSIAACSAQIYAQRGGLGGNLIAFDPLFGESISPSAIPCLPTEVTSSWYQSNSDITTVLGPTFVCPGAYSAVQTILVDSSTQQVLCCPSQYSLFIQITGQGGFPTQCTSHLTSGQALTYQSTTPSGSWGPATSTVPDSTAISTGPTIVYAMHVNGFNVISSTSQSSDSSNSAISTSPPTVPATTTSNSLSQIPQTSAPAALDDTSRSSKSLSAGAAAGIAIGVILAVGVAAVGAWFVFRRTRKKNAERQRSMRARENHALYEVDGAMSSFRKSQGIQEMHSPFEMHAPLSSKRLDGNQEIHEML